jgi:hypothetical protein
MVLRYVHLSPANAAGAARAVGTSVAQALRRRKNPTERKLQAERQLKWWVLTGSNRRPSPCKGDPAGQSRVSVESRYCNRLIPLATKLTETCGLDGRCDRRAQESTEGHGRVPQISRGDLRVPFAGLFIYGTQPRGWPFETSLLDRRSKCDAGFQDPSCHRNGAMHIHLASHRSDREQTGPHYGRCSSKAHRSRPFTTVRVPRLSRLSASLCLCAARPDYRWVGGDLIRACRPK